MSYFALIPKEEITEDFNPTIASRKNWLSLTKADQLICNHFNVVSDPKYYYKIGKTFYIILNVKVQSMNLWEYMKIG